MLVLVLAASKLHNTPGPAGSLHEASSTKGIKPEQTHEETFLSMAAPGKSVHKECELNL